MSTSSPRAAYSSWIFVLLLMPSVTELLETGALPSLPREFFPDLMVTFAMADILFVMRRQSLRLAHDALERAEQERALRHADRLATVGQLAAGMFDKPFETDDLRTCIVHMLMHERRWRPKRAAPRVLVADDDTELRRLVASELRKLGWEVEEAGSGFALLDRLGDAELDVDPFALIVTDVRMPGVTGLSVLRGLRSAESERLGGTPVLLMTASGDDATRGEARQLGALLLDKPFDMDELRMWSRLLIERP